MTVLKCEDLMLFNLVKEEVEAARPDVLVFSRGKPHQVIAKRFRHDVFL